MPRSMVIPGREHTPAYRRSIPLNHLGRLGSHTGSIDCTHLAAIKPYPRKTLHQRLMFGFQIRFLKTSPFISSLQPLNIDNAGVTPGEMVYIIL